ncbi:MAG: hypothetical protein EBU93_04545, partial [Chlamydiae bacterium]|nr:hypothetical protein [Chlamydiota bacterium]
MKYISFTEYSSEIEFDWLQIGLGVRRYQTKLIDCINFQKTFWSHLSDEEIKERIMNSDHRHNVLRGTPPCDGHFVCENGSEFKVCLCNGDDSIVFI